MTNQKLTPSAVYSYFKKQQKNISGIMYGHILNTVLDGIMAGSIFEENDYEMLFSSLHKNISIPHKDVEEHYRVAIENGNNTAWKSIELFLNRKPYLIDGKRCYKGMEFLDGNDKYKCTGWSSNGNIKFVLIMKESRKLLNLSRSDFDAHFKGKKIEKIKNYYSF